MGSEEDDTQREREGMNFEKAEMPTMVNKARNKARSKQ